MVSDILVIDDELDIRDLICDVLKDEAYSTRQASNSLEAFKRINEKIPTAVILDIWLKGSELDGLGIVEILAKQYPNLPIIMISGHGNIETAVSAIKLGAYDYVEKPFTEDKLLIVLKRACDFAKLSKENLILREKIGKGDVLIGNSALMKKLNISIEKVAASFGRVLITGPSGCGKKIVAKLIHMKSTRANEPFINFDSSGIKEEDASIALFGSENTNFYNGPRKIGLLECANGGTFFIDEVGNLAPSIQNRLLHFLQHKTMSPIGSTNKINIDVRIIASSSKNLLNLIKNGQFREDLYYRLNVVPIEVPSLSQRKDDIPLLCKYFLHNFHNNDKFPLKKISPEAIITLQSYDWPGNVRQLKNVLEWSLIMFNDDAIIKSDMLPVEISSNVMDYSLSNIGSEIMSLCLKDARELFEKQYLSTQLKRFNNSVAKMANAIGMERSALHRKLKSLEINID